MKQVMSKHDAAICVRVLMRLERIVERSRDANGLITRDGMDLCRMIGRLQADMFGYTRRTLLDEGRFQEAA